MKKIIPVLILGTLLFSCEKDETKVTLSSDPTPPIVTNHMDGFSREVTDGNQDEVVAFAWTPADYGVTTQVTYTVEIDSAGRSFSTPAVVGATSNLDLSLTLGDLNNMLLNQLKITANKTASLEVRVVASINTAFKEASPVLHLMVKPLKKFDPENPGKLWVPGAYQGWAPGTAPVIYGVSFTEYEGYVSINAGTGFKFTTAPDWDHVNYGMASATGHLTTNGLADGMSAPEAGYYRFKANVQDLTYESYNVHSFGLIGTATPGAWDNSTPMVYDDTSGKWTKTIDLISGALKFRANNEWAVNYGPADSNVPTGTLIATDDAITISEAGNYTVSIDMSRASTHHLYTYTVTKNE